MQDNLVLFVDDDELVIKSKTILLERAGYTLVSSGDPVSAMELLDEFNFRILITDLFFNGRAVDDTFNLISVTLLSGMRVIVYSGAGWGERPDIQGVVFIQKPDLSNELTSMVSRLCGICHSPGNALSAQEGDALSNPFAHVQDPVRKWETDEITLNPAVSSRELIAVRKELRVLESDLTKPGFSRRELDEMMRKRDELMARLKNLRMERLSPGKSRVRKS